MKKTDAAQFVRTAREVFAPLYPVVAERIKEETGITRGRCLDLGSGPGLLGLAVAEITELEVLLLDISPEMLAFAEEGIAERERGSRVSTLLGDVHRIPLESGSVDLVVSRGSVFFWKEPARAFREVWRVLAPGGYAWIGGGFGNGDLKREITAQMRERDPQWEPQVRERTSDFRLKAFRDALAEAGIEKFLIDNDDRGFWIRFAKESREGRPCR